MNTVNREYQRTLVVSVKLGVKVQTYAMLLLFSKKKQYYYLCILLGTTQFSWLKELSQIIPVLRKEESSQNWKFLKIKKLKISGKEKYITILKNVTW